MKILPHGLQPSALSLSTCQPALPIFAILPELRVALQERRAVILAAPPGSGKTTGVPPALLAEPWLAGRSIVMLEPRRLATRMAATRMASLLREPVGGTIGYRVRMESKVSVDTRIEVVTEGILTRRLQQDPFLQGVGLVIFDEFHERSIHADLSLALCLDVMAALRPDLKIMLMSATLDVDALARFLDNPAVIVGAGQEFPITIRYGEELGLGSRLVEACQGPYSFRSLQDLMTSAVQRAIVEEDGDILAFLPGVGEIRQVKDRLSPWAKENNIVLRPLYGDMPGRDQDQALVPDPGGQRRVVLTTSVAETSLTIEGVRVVIDSGWSRVPRFDPNSGLSCLTTMRVSLAAATQRTGRAGRLGPGVCYRLWHRGLDHTLPLHGRPEILEADLAHLVLELALWGVTSPDALAWLDLPPAGHYAQARDLLHLLGAVDKRGRITAKGKEMASLPVHPRLACMLLAAGRSGRKAMACDLAALLTERDILQPSDGPRPVDLDLRLQILDASRRGQANLLHALDGDPLACARVDKASCQWQRLLPKEKRGKAGASAGALLAQAYPDRIAQVRPGARERFRLANGRGAVLVATDPLAGAPYLVAARMDAGQKEGRIYLAAALTEAELLETMAGRIVTRTAVFWDDQGAAVVASREERLGELVLRSRPAPDADPLLVRAAMLEGVRRLGLAALPWTEAARALQARILWLRLQQGDEAWPDVEDAALLEQLDSWLGPHLDGISRSQHLARLDLTAILTDLLDWRLRRRLDEEAPTHISVPSGSRLPLVYTPGQPPVLAVRLQEMFGLADTPTIGKGRVPVILHLLSPARRPMQVTQDLRGFWNSTYQEVKKELKGRYPKHHWPDDPWSAAPTARVKPRPRKK